MRVTATNTVMRARAIAGTYVVTLAWDFQPGQDGKREGLMGFAVERTELKGGQIVERYWMRSIKRFRDKDRGLLPGTPVSTADHPIQSFQWADYTTQANCHYRYRIVPVYGLVKTSPLTRIRRSSWRLPPKSSSFSSRMPPTMRRATMSTSIAASSGRRLLHGALRTPIRRTRAQNRKRWCGYREGCMKRCRPSSALPRMNASRCAQHYMSFTINRSRTPSRRVDHDRKQERSQLASEPRRAFRSSSIQRGVVLC
ncbi:hypothetical protein BCL32_0064 [Rhizobium mongolense USDA 1844]|uniref:Uncharacterized protein n=2 Tax=Rhizobium mongolense TaxID=57676 RepID=A0A559TJG6_9HYPH|nr:hypothetical protein BCL32_0064 [Rhizobium mongolense USDA 1844]